jgi:hypothetical protein
MLRFLIVAMTLAALSLPAEARHRHGRHHGLPWCGIYLGKYLGKPDRKLWVARNWAREGSNAGGPGVGVVVVWPHHVGIIEGRAGDGEWIVRSGNDGGAVRSRPRSLSRVIAFRRM